MFILMGVQKNKRILKGTLKGRIRTPKALILLIQQFCSAGKFSKKII